jgi:heme exporter protein A
VPVPPVNYAIRIEGLEKRFGDRPIIWDLNLTVDWGELLILVGANGSGKTTLLSLISNQIRPDAGTMFVAGFDYRLQMQVIRRRIGVVGHRTFLYDGLTCLENLLLYARLFALKQPQQRAYEALSRVGMESRAHHQVKTLSNGMQKRVSIARAILHQPQLLILDEPETGLDHQSVSLLKDILVEWTKTGKSIVMSTHNLELAVELADRVAVLSGGRLHNYTTKPHLEIDKLRNRLTTSLEGGRE